MITKLTTLEQFIIDKQGDFPFATGELSSLLRDLSLAAKIVNREVNKAGLVDILGDLSTCNVQGEQQKKLDVFANEHFIKALSSGGECCLVASEELDDPIYINNEVSKSAKYLVCIDPLDGSSNVDVNVSVGTIFSIYRRTQSEGPITLDEVLQRGTEQVAAGYFIYGSSTMMVYTTGKGVNGFTLDPSIGEFCLSYPKMRFPDQGRIYSINEGNYLRFPQSVKEYIKYCQQNDKETDRPYTSRYIGSMVADIHRNLLKGGIFLYPATLSHPKGKLRLVYECNPIAFIVEQAGGIATNGKKRILEISPSELHQRVPFFAGSKDMVNKLSEFIEKHQHVNEFVE